MKREGRDAAARTNRAGAARRYHHGDLPAALVDAALELVGEKGVQGFSVSEVARRVGVSSAAPYRHFASRDHLLAAVALRGYKQVAETFGAAFATAGPRPADKLAACAGAYVRFAAEQPAMFEVLFGAGLDKSEHPDLRQASDNLIAAVWPVVIPLTPDGTDAQAWALIQAVVGLAHGYSALLLDGALEHFTPDGATCAPGPARPGGTASRRPNSTGGASPVRPNEPAPPRPIPEAEIAAAESQAIAATRALLRGRSLLFPAK